MQNFEDLIANAIAAIERIAAYPDFLEILLEADPELEFGISDVHEFFEALLRTHQRLEKNKDNILSIESEEY